MRIAVIDDNPRDRGRFARALRQGQNADVLAVGSVADFVAQIADYEPDVLLLDDRLGPLQNAEDSLRIIGDNLGVVPTIVMSSDVSSARRAELVRMGAIECVEKDSLDDDAMNLILAMAAQCGSVLKRQMPITEPAAPPAVLR